MKKNIKADVPINKFFEEKLFDHQFHQSQNLLLTEEAFCISASAEDWVLKERYTKENSSSSLHTQWAIDQGATRLGGYRYRVHAKRWGLPFFSRLYSMLKHGQNSEYFKFIICPDVNFWVWDASEFNKSKILSKECSRFSLLHIQKICVKGIWNVCTFH